VTAALDLLDPRWRRDRTALYAQLRERAPVCWNPRLRMWVVTRYDDVLAVVQGADYSVDRFARIDSAALLERPDLDALRRMLRDWAVYRDPPDHTRLRALLAQSFTPRQIERMSPRIQAIVDELLDRAVERRDVDFVADFAFPLPATVVASMLGVPTGDLDKVKLWSDQIASYIGGAQAGRNNVDAAQRGLFEACDYFRRLARARRAQPDDDVLSLLIAAEERGQGLSEEELVANCVLLLFAGHETTANLIGNGLLHLLEHPAEMERLRRNPELAPSAVEELLRFDPPVSGTIRIAVRDLELHGQQIAEGQQVACMLASANRDPQRFPEPDRLDLARAPNRHLAFGYGIHFCVGAALARLEAQIAFRTLLARFPKLRGAGGEPVWKPQVFFHGLERFPVELAS
jgi:cytochrome P450